MKPSSVNAKTSRIKARNAALMNLLGTPGLGSLMAGRIVVGVGQLAFALSGFVLVTIWFVQTMRSYYGQMFNSDGTSHRPVVLTGLILGSTLFAIGWFWSLVTSLSLMREAKNSEADELKMFSATAIKLDEIKIIAALGALPQWARSGVIITRTFEFADFVAAMKFASAVAEIAKAAQHHPDVDIRANKVTLALTTHDTGGLTEKDFALARQCDVLAEKSRTP
jgi:4a-hydroxytetrahydrobiopterin dehydratase